MKSISILKKPLNDSRAVFSKRFSRFSRRLRLLRCACSSEKLSLQTPNQRTKNHRSNCAVQAILFGMVERGMGGPVMGDKGKLRSNPNPSSSSRGDGATWAVVLTEELWKKGI